LGLGQSDSHTWGDSGIQSKIQSKIQNRIWRRIQSWSEIRDLIGPSAVLLVHLVHHGEILCTSLDEVLLKCHKIHVARDTGYRPFFLGSIPLLLLRRQVWYSHTMTANFHRELVGIISFDFEVIHD
jgi:hypothetical protein